MKWTPENRRDLRLLATMLAASAVIASLTWLLMPPPRTGGLQAQPSTFFNEPYGAKAAFQVLGELGFNITRLRRPIDADTLAGIDALVLLRPVECLHPHEERTLRAWVENGNRLLVAPRFPGDSALDCYAEETEAEDCIRPVDWFELATMVPVHADVEVQELHPRPGGDAFLLGDVETVKVVEGHRFDLESPMVWPEPGLAFEAILADDAGVVALSAEYGAGRIIALADVHALTNAALDEADHPAWLAHLATVLSDGDPAAVLAVDEYHHGFPYHERPWVAMIQLLWDQRWGWSALQIVLVSGLALYGAGRHFGRPEGVPARSRRTQGEFTSAAGRLLHQARAGGVALAAIWRHHRERLCRAAQLPSGCTDMELINALDRQGQVEAARAAEAAIVQHGKQRVPDATLLELARRLHTAVETLEHGTGPSR